MDQLLDIIDKKFKGQVLTNADISHVVAALKENDDVSHVQLAALLMAWHAKGTEFSESVQLALLLYQAEQTINWPLPNVNSYVNLHVVGDFNDKLSLVLAPVLAACEVKVPLLSVRCLGYTGTLMDKVEALRGFQGNMPRENMIGIVQDISWCIAEQTGTEHSPQRKLVDLCHITGTAKNFKLMSASLFARKASQNPGLLVVVIAYGKAALLQTKKEAEELASSMFFIAKELQLHIRILLVPISNPVGQYLGNGLEVQEAVNCLANKGPEDLQSLACQVGGQILLDLEKAETLQEGAIIVSQCLKDGSARKSFAEMMKVQGVDKADLKVFHKKENIEALLSPPKYSTYLSSEEEGYVHNIDADAIRLILGGIGAGRLLKSDNVDKATGIALSVHIGSNLKKGSVWGMLHHNSRLTEFQREKLKTVLKLQAVEPSKNSEDLRVEVFENKQPFSELNVLKYSS